MPWEVPSNRFRNVKTDVEKPFFTFFKLSSDGSCAGLNLDISNAKPQSSILVRDQNAYLKDDKGHLILIGEIRTVSNKEFLVLEGEGSDGIFRLENDQIENATLILSTKKVVRDISVDSQGQVILGDLNVRKDIMSTPNHKDSGVIVKLSVICKKH